MVLPGSVFNLHLLNPVVKTALFFMKKHVWLRTNNSRKSVPTARAVTQKAGWVMATFGRKLDRSRISKGKELLNGGLKNEINTGSWCKQWDFSSTEIL